MADAAPTLDVTETSPGYEERFESWQKVRDALEGEDAIKARTTAYLPKPSGMKVNDYRNYVARSVFYGISERTLRGLEGLILRVDPIVKLPPRLEPINDFASPEGFTVRQLVRETLREVLSLGRYGILVDMPPSTGLNTLPYFATYKAEQIFRWEEIVDPETQLRKPSRVVVLEEPSNANDQTTRFIREMFLDENGLYAVNVYREVEPERDGRSTRVRRQTSAGSRTDFITGSFELETTYEPTMRGQRMTEIPFFFVNPFDMRARTSKPPFLDLVNMNLAHYRNSADMEMALFLTASPTPYIFGVGEGDVPKSIGPSVIWHSQQKDVRAGFIEFKGTGMSAQRLAMRDKEDRMAVLGARLVRTDGAERENVTAETTRLESREETSVLVGVTQTVEEAYRRAFRFAASWIGASPDALEFGLNRDFVEVRLTDRELVALVAAWQAGAISRETLHGNLQRGEIVPADRNLDEELGLIEEEGALDRPAPGGGAGSPNAMGDDELPEDDDGGGDDDEEEEEDDG